MKGVVLAAGKGTRMEDLTENKPKGLIKISGKPLLTYCFEELEGLGIGEIIVVVGYNARKIKEFYGDNFNSIPIKYVYQKRQLGLAHALLETEPHIQDSFVLIHGDNLFMTNLKEVLGHHRQKQPTSTILTKNISRDEAKNTGVIKFDKNGDPKKIIEKPESPSSTTVTTGFSIHTTDIFYACNLVLPSNRGEYELSDAIDLLLYAGHQIETIKLDGKILNMNTPQDKKKAEKTLNKKH